MEKFAETVFNVIAQGNPLFGFLLLVIGGLFWWVISINKSQSKIESDHQKQLKEASDRYNELAINAQKQLSEERQNYNELSDKTSKAIEVMQNQIMKTNAAHTETNIQYTEAMTGLTETLNTTLSELKKDIEREK